MCEEYIMKIGNRQIGPEIEPLIIAEIGINHGGDLDVAKQMVKEAARAGVECVKHQTHFVEDEMTPEAKNIFPPNADKSIWDVMEGCALSKKNEIELQKFAIDLGLIYISTPFSRKAADFLYEIDVPAFKIGSGEVDNIPLVEHIAQMGKPMIVSTGMRAIEELDQTVNVLRENKVEYALLECTNLYPSPPGIVSLRGITELKNRYPDAIIGFSDHSIGSEMAMASVALGSCILERHFTDSRYRIGPDISCSMDPCELMRLIRYSKEIHTALQNKKMRTNSEESVYTFARSSVVADKDLKQGHVLTGDDLWARRPGSGEIPGKNLKNLIGKSVNRDIGRNTQISWSFLN